MRCGHRGSLRIWRLDGGDSDSDPDGFEPDGGSGSGLADFRIGGSSEGVGSPRMLVY